MLNGGKNADFTVEVREVVAEPKVVNSRIEHKWLQDLHKPFFSKGYDLIGLHCSLKQWKEWGIKPSLRGANLSDKIEQEDFYFSADENTRRDGENRFIQTCLHEIAHGYYQETKLIDQTHDWHSKNPDISGLFKTIDWARYQPKRMTLRKIRDILEIVLDLSILKKFRSEKKLLPLVQRKANAVVTEMARLGHPVRINEGFRSFERQDALYRQGRFGDTRPIVTNARAGESMHNYGVAVDFVFIKEGYNASEMLWQKLGQVGKAQGFEWGGDWKNFVDRPHFELVFDFSLKDFQENKVDYSAYL